MMPSSKNTKQMRERLGPAFLTGTVADCKVVKAGVSSCTFAFAACN